MRRDIPHQVKGRKNMQEMLQEWKIFGDNMKLKIPKTIKIGNSVYNVNHVSMVNYSLNPIKLFKRLLLGESIVGQICPQDREIRLKKDSYDIQNTFLHEVAHGIMWEMKKKYPHAEAWVDDEAFTDRLAVVLSKTFNSLMKQQKQTQKDKKK
jgi:hypothetical protein